LRSKLIIALILASAVIAAGCASMIEGDLLNTIPNPGTPYEKPPEEQIEVTNYEELYAEVFELVMQHEETGNMYANSYDGDVESDVKRVCREIANDNPIGAYAVAGISAETKRIVTIYEIGISIEYKRTKQQLDALVNVSTLRFLRTELLSAMGNYNDEAVFRTSMNITEEDIIGYAREAYYQNPRRIVMLPVAAVEFYPESGEDRIFEVRFGNIEQAGILRQYGTNLAELYVRRNALNAVGDTDAEILLSLANNLIASTGYDFGTARAISVHGAQNFAATAYGALANGNAVGEGFAMAYKALCDELGFDCRIVLGYLEGRVHAWNIVSLFGDFYHIDVAMCAVNGIETAFLKTDEDFAGLYSWDTDNTVSCRGTLTYEDIVGIEEPDDTDGEPGEPGEGGEGGENTETPGGTASGDREGEPSGKPQETPQGETETGETEGEDIIETEQPVGDDDGPG